VSSLNDYKPVKATKKPFTIVFTSEKTSPSVEKTVISDQKWMCLLNSLETVLLLSLAIVESLYSQGLSEKYDTASEGLEVGYIQQYFLELVATVNFLVLKPTSVQYIGRFASIRQCIEAVGVNDCGTLVGLLGVLLVVTLPSIPSLILTFWLYQARTEIAQVLRI
jgi:hypothetical protein